MNRTNVTETGYRNNIQMIVVINIGKIIRNANMNAKMDSAFKKMEHALKAI